MQRFFSGSSAQENAEVTRASFSWSLGGGVVGGRHVAWVKRSTSLRTKMRGNVPPKLETLEYLLVVDLRNTWGFDLRGEEGHVSTANARVCTECMEG